MQIFLVMKEQLESSYRQNNKILREERGVVQDKGIRSLTVLILKQSKDKQK